MDITNFNRSIFDFDIDIIENTPLLNISDDSRLNTVKDLRLNGMFFKSGDLFRRSLEALAKCKNLLKLDLSGNHLYNLTLGQFAELLTVIAELPLLRVLHLRANGIGKIFEDFTPEQLSTMFQSLVSLPALTNLDLSINRIKTLSPIFDNILKDLLSNDGTLYIVDLAKTNNHHVGDLSDLIEYTKNNNHHIHYYKDYLVPQAEIHTQIATWQQQSEILDLTQSDGHGSLSPYYFLGVYLPTVASLLTPPPEKTNLNENEIPGQYIANLCLFSDRTKQTAINKVDVTANSSCSASSSSSSCSSTLK